MDLPWTRWSWHSALPSLMGWLAVWERGEQVMLPTSDFSEDSDLVFHSFHPEGWWNMSWIKIQVRNCWEGSETFVAVPDGEVQNRLSQACVKSYMAKGGEAPDMRYNSGDPKLGQGKCFSLWGTKQRGRGLERLWDSIPCSCAACCSWCCFERGPFQPESLSSSIPRSTELLLPCKFSLL